MYSEEEPELRDLIIQNLENCGLLNKIKAELRAGVFLALEENGDLKKKIPLCNEKFDKFAATNEGKLMLSLVREFLEYFSLDFTLSVFEPEVASFSSFLSRPELCEQLNLKPAEINGPVISEFFKDISYQKKYFSEKLSSEMKTVPEKPLSILNETEKIIPDNTFKFESSKNRTQNDAKTNSIGLKDLNETLDNDNTFTVADLGDISKNESTDIQVDGANKSDKFKEILSSDHDPFFDEPVPSEKSSFFNFSETLKDKSETKASSSVLNDPPKSSLSSLKDLPSLTTNHEWTFNREPLSNFPSLDLLKSSVETSKQETDSKELFEKKDPEVNEDSSEKQISEESIEEQLEEDFSAGMDDLLNSSLSLADDVTTDQTVSQVSAVEGLDHIEPCNN